MFASTMKAVALGLVLALAAPTPQAQARHNTGKFIAAAIIGAAIVSAASNHHRDRSYGSYGYAPRVYYPPQTYYAPQAYYTPQAYYQNGYAFGAGCGPYAPAADIYSTNSGYGYDRYGSYIYDTGRISTYGGGRCDY
ncbi:MAG: hypothetical protein HY303_08210 [Candidatus Wallbacteria bacterium]|nr:hypothetical protein [Candidatus Wallbacteria bacterium]